MKATSIHSIGSFFASQIAFLCRFWLGYKSIQPTRCIETNGSSFFLTSLSKILASESRGPGTTFLDKFFMIAFPIWALASSSGRYYAIISVMPCRSKTLNTFNPRSIKSTYVRSPNSS